MKGALEEYREGVKKGIRVSVHLLSRAWGVLRPPLQRSISGKVAGSAHVSGRKPYLPEEAERVLPKDDPMPHLLLLDGHSSHVYNLEFIKLLKSKNVHIMCYPSHTTHALQPADKALFKSLKHHWDQEGRKRRRMMAGQKLLRMEFFPVFSRAWAKAATVENAQAGFRGMGMFPLNKDVLPETAFAPSKTTERVLPPTLPSLHTRPQCLLSPPTRPPPLPPLPTGPRAHLPTLTHSAHLPLALLSGHQPSHQSSASLTPLLPVEPLYFFPDETVVFEEVVLESVPGEDTDLFNAFPPQVETHSQDEEPSTSTVSDILCYFQT